MCVYIYICIYNPSHVRTRAAADDWAAVAGIRSAQVRAVSVKKHSFCASPCPAVRQQKLQSSP